MLRTALAALLVMGTALPAPAQEEEVLARIETIHGDAEGFAELFGGLQDALMFEDHESFANLADYPLRINTPEGEALEIETADDLLADWEYMVTPDVAEAVLGADFADLVVTSEGVGIGGGAVWATNICLDEGCADTYWAVIAINQ